MERKEQSVATKRAVAAVRSLVIDMTNKANSGHPGMALDATPAMVALFRDHLVADPEHPAWENRDRFVLSSGHVSALLYSMLHVSGYALRMDDLKAFRQLGSLTPGHPEVGLTPGVDATSGPLGQGIAQAVGMAIAEEAVRASGKDRSTFFGHRTYCLCGDGCLQEGIGAEAIALAGHLRLSNLILLVDLNGSTLDGPTSDSNTENVRLRFLAEEWDVIDVKNGDSVDAMSRAIEKAKKNIASPTAILFHTTIGIGSKNAGSHKTHGSPLGEEDGAFAKASFGYNEPPFTVEEAVYDLFRETFAKRGKEAFSRYEQAKKDFAKNHADDARVFDDSFSRNLVPYLPSIRDFSGVSKEATRVSSGLFLERLHASMPFCIGGSADVAGSTKTTVKGSSVFTPENREGRDIHFGIREFAMASAVNGMALHGGLVPYCATFFVFSDYCKPALRMAAMEKIPSVFLFTHDSLAVGEDGATHEPIEQLAGLRAIPNLSVIRPADAKETEGAWRLALESKETPTAIILSRQNLPVLPSTSETKVSLGAYAVHEEESPTIKLLASGSEVSLALSAADILREKGIAVRVLSVPSFDLLRRSLRRGETVFALPRENRFSLEMASTFGWAEFAAHSIGIDEYGLSGKDKEVLAHFGFTPEKVADAIVSVLKEGK